MSVRTIKYLVVDNVVDDVPDAAPEIDATIDSASDVAGALIKIAGVPSSADIYLRTQRPDGSLRWQPLSAVAALPDDSMLLAKVVRGKGPSRPAAAQRPGSQQYQAAAAPAGSGSSGLGHALGGLFKKLAVGGSSCGASHTGMGSSSSGGGFGRMGGLGLGAAGSGRDDGADEFERQLREQQMTQELEDGVQRRDNDNDNGDNEQGWVAMDNNAGPEPEQSDRTGEDGWQDMDNNAGPEPEECYHNTDDDGANDGNDNDNDDFKDNEDGNEGWQDMDNDAGPEPEPDNDDNDNNDDDYDDDGGGGSSD